MPVQSVGDVFAQRLPASIRAAQQRAGAETTLWSISSRAARLVQILLTFTPVDDLHAPLRFLRATPARLLGVTVRTIDRELNALAGAGLVTRCRQRRLPSGGWSCTSVSWTAQALAMLGLSGAKSVSRPAPLSSPSRATFKSHRSSSFGESSYEDKPVLPGTRGIPSDLQPAVQQYGWVRRDVVFLMSVAKKSGHRLQTVLQYAADHLLAKGLTGEQAKRFVLYLMGLGKDLGALVKACETRVQEKVRAKAAALAEEEFSKALTKVGVRLPCGGTVVAVEGPWIRVSDGDLTNPRVWSAHASSLAKRLNQRGWKPEDLAGATGSASAALPRNRTIAVEPFRLGSLQLATIGGEMAVQHPNSAPISTPNAEMRLSVLGRRQRADENSEYGRAAGHQS